MALSQETRAAIHVKTLFRGKELQMTHPIKSLLNRFIQILFMLAVLIWLANTPIAASSPGHLSGTVVDPAGAGVPNARVLVRDKAGVVIYEARTDSAGGFSLSDVSEGTYTVVVEAEGFTQPDKAIAQVAPGASGDSVSIKLAVAALSDQLVVTATRTETPADELGGSVSIATSEDMGRANQSLISEPLRLMPGVAVVQTGGRGGLTSVFTRGGDSTFNKVLIDGVPVNLAGGSFDFSDLVTENLDRVEVVRGPGSALFGSDAMTSVIQLVTKRGTTSQPDFELSAEGGSFDFHRETARLSGLVGLFDYSTSFGFQTTNGRFRNSDFTNRSLSSNFGFRLASDVQLRITARWNGNTLGVPGPTAVLFADPDERQKHHDLALAATLDYRTSPRWHNSVRFIYSESETHSFDPAAQDLTVPGTPLLPPGAFGDDFVSDFIDHEKRSGVHYQSIASIGRSNVLTAGVDFEHESAVFTNSTPLSRVSPDRNDLGIYVQDQAAWRGRLFASGGVRIERNSGRVPRDFTQTQGNAPLGDVGFGWTANPKLAVSLLARRHRESGALGATRLKASFGTGIKEPTLLEAFSPDPSFIGNPALNPERAISYEAGVAQEFFGRKANVELTYFDNRFRDLVLFEETPSFGPIALPDGRLTNFFNAARSSARGIELVATARPAHGVWSHLRITGSYTFLRTRLDQSADILAFPPPTFQGVLVPDPEVGLPLLRRPRNSGTFLLSWIDRRFDLTFDGSIVGRRRDFDPVTFSKFDAAGRPIFNDGYARLDASGSLEVTRNLRAFVRIENLLNQDYQEVLGFPAYRLNFSAGLRIRIGGKR
jgi:vitamin B12 transporter